MNYKRVLKITLKVLLVLLVAAVAFFTILAAIFSFGSRAPAEKVTWGVNFSQKHAAALGLDWRETYLAILNDLGVHNIRIASHWDLIEKEPGKFDFTDLDWQIEKATAQNDKVILAVGMKTPRWPECHIPGWTKDHDASWMQDRVSAYVRAVVERYRANKNIVYWQIENEPFFQFGECPPIDPAFLQKEVAQVREIDPKLQVMITESGEFSWWRGAASLGDAVGVTLYREAYFSRLGMFLRYPMTPTFYRRKAQLIGWLYGKKVIPIEVQAEPWFQSYPLGVPGQNDLVFGVDKLTANLEYARETGAEEIYPWGAEWWYYQKTKQNNPAFWDEAKKIFAK